MQFSKDGVNFDIKSSPAHSCIKAIDQAIKAFRLGTGDFLYVRHDENDKPTKMLIESPRK